MSCEDYELYCSQDLPLLCGYPNIVHKDKNYPSEIFSFGVRCTGEQSRLDFCLPLKYAGETTIDGHVYDLFLLPENGLDNLDLWTIGRPFYLMLEVIDNIAPDKWFLFHPHTNRCKTVRKVFNKKKQ